VLAVIGGSGLYELDGLEDGQSRRVETRYGSTSGRLVSGSLEQGPVLFIARHGEDHSVAPHLVNYRANVEALKEAGATAVLAVCTSGSIDPMLLPGTIAVPDQIVDYTWGREQTFHGPGDAVPHVDFTDPYSPPWREEVVAALAGHGLPFRDGATYAAVQGPRFESAAEIRRFRNDGCTIIGMTGMPEAALAREAGLQYAAICPIANLAAGLSPRELTADEVFGQVSSMIEPIQSVIATLTARTSRHG
jgi:5'-methylthioinosine phosphorylase